MHQLPKAQHGCVSMIMTAKHARKCMLYVTVTMMRESGGCQKKKTSNRVTVHGSTRLTKIKMKKPKMTPTRIPTIPPIAIAAGSAVLPTAAASACVCVSQCVRPYVD